MQKCSHNENKTAKTTYNNIQVLVEYYTSNKQALNVLIS